MLVDEMQWYPALKITKNRCKNAITYLKSCSSNKSPLRYTNIVM